MKFFISLFKQIPGWLTKTFSDSDGIPSSKRQLMTFLVICLGIAFLRNVEHPKEAAPSEILINAVVTVICFLGGATVGDKIGDLFLKKNDSPKDSTPKDPEV